MSPPLQPVRVYVVQLLWGFLRLREFRECELRLSVDPTIERMFHQLSGHGSGSRESEAVPPRISAALWFFSLL